MKTEIEDQYFLVCGASSGFGKAVAESLLREKATVIGIARNQNKLNYLLSKFPDKFIPIQADLTQPDTMGKISDTLDLSIVKGVFINAGGPPAKSFMETELTDWDNAYSKLLRWKVDLAQKIIPHFKKNRYGRILFLESSSVKQPIENLVLSTSIRMAVVGMARTIATENAIHGITANVLAPGSHDTAALERLFQKKAETDNISVDQARQVFQKQTGMGTLGEASDLASLAVWLLSPASKFVTGQTISVAGNAIQGTFG